MIVNSWEGRAREGKGTCVQGFVWFCVVFCFFCQGDQRQCRCGFDREEGRFKIKTCFQVNCAPRMGKIIFESHVMIFR